MTAEDDAEVFQVLAAQLENEGSLSTPSAPDSELHELDPNVVPADVRAALEAILLVASDPVPPTAAGSAAAVFAGPLLLRVRTVRPGSSAKNV